MQLNCELGKSLRIISGAVVCFKNAGATINRLFISSSALFNFRKIWRGLAMTLI